MPITRLLVLLITPFVAYEGQRAQVSRANGEAVVKAMHEKYAGKWYTTMSFTQKTTLANGTVQTWYETMELPRILRIDIAPLDSGNAALYHNDTVYSFRGGALRSARFSINPLLVLGFDVYADTVDATVRRMKTFNIDFTKVSENTWQGRPMYVVGAARGDSTSPQFWVDKERLLFTRMFTKSANGAVTEYQFNKYSRIGGGWISAEVLFFTNGQAGNKEEYTNIKIGEVFPPGFFDPSKFAKRAPPSPPER
jgi:hypothetical protein